MAALVFVDTNILVYAREAENTVKRARAREWLEVLWRDLRGRTSIQVLNEYYAVLTQGTKYRVDRESAWDDVLELLEWNPQEIDAEVLTRAHEIESRFQLSWWDCLIVAAAQAQTCTLLLTEDLQDGANYGNVIARNPFKLGVTEPAATYSALPKIATRHRGRGRPRTSAKRPIEAAG
jgi:predicted nucleic acid-binding protein